MYKEIREVHYRHTEISDKNAVSPGSEAAQGIHPRPPPNQGYPHDQHTCGSEVDGVHDEPNADITVATQLKQAET